MVIAFALKCASPAGLQRIRSMIVLFLRSCYCLVFLLLLLLPLLLLFCVEYWFWNLSKTFLLTMAFLMVFLWLTATRFRHHRRWEKRKFAVRQNGLFICKVICSPNVIVAVCRCGVNAVANGTRMRWWKWRNMFFMGCISLYSYMSFSRKREFYAQCGGAALFDYIFFIYTESYLNWVLCNVFGDISGGVWHFCGAALRTSWVLYSRWPYDMTPFMVLHVFKCLFHFKNHKIYIKLLSWAFIWCRCS